MGYGKGEAHAHLGDMVVSIALHIRKVRVNREVMPCLRLKSCKASLSSLVLQVKETTFSWVYNQTIWILEERIKEAVCAGFEQALSNNVASFLGPLNEHLRPLWPTLTAQLGTVVDKLPWLDDAMTDMKKK